MIIATAAHFNQAHVLWFCFMFGELLSLLGLLSVSNLLLKVVVEEEEEEKEVVRNAKQHN